MKKVGNFSAEESSGTVWRPGRLPFICRTIQQAVSTAAVYTDDENVVHETRRVACLLKYDACNESEPRTIIVVFS
jgi:hypothetical protein